MSTTNKKRYPHYVAGNGLRVYHNGVADSKILPFVFIHGTGMYAMVFAIMFEILESLGIRAYSIELRYHGTDSSAEDLKKLGKMTVEQYAQEVQQVVEEIGHCTLLGWSMGGLIAQLVARDCYMVDRVVPMASAPSKWTFLGWKVTIKMLHWRYLIAMLGKPFRFVEKHVKELMLPRGLSESETKEILSGLRNDSGTYLTQVALPGGINIQAGSIHCPMLFLACSKDYLLPPKIQKRFQERHDADWLEIDASHAFVFERKACEAALDGIIEWVERGQVFRPKFTQKQLLNREQLAHG